MCPPGRQLRSTSQEVPQKIGGVKLCRHLTLTFPFSHLHSPALTGSLPRQIPASRLGVRLCFQNDPAKWHYFLGDIYVDCVCGKRKCYLVNTCMSPQTSAGYSKFKSWFQVQNPDSLFIAVSYVTALSLHIYCLSPQTVAVSYFYHFLPVC